MFAWKCGVFLLLAVRANGANGANGMEAKQEPEEFDEDLAHALAVSLQDANGLEGQQEPEEFDDLLAHALAVGLREAGMASPDADDQELEDDPYMEVLSTDREDLFADSAEECAAVEDGQGSEEDLEFLAAEEGPPLPNPLGAFANATAHVDIDLFALYSQSPGTWQRTVTVAWKKATLTHHPDGTGNHGSFLQLTNAKEKLVEWISAFKEIREAWPDCHLQCFCADCLRVLKSMVNCGKCLGLKTNHAHSCGAFSKDCGIFMQAAKNRPYRLQLAMLVAHGKSEEAALEEVRAQIAEDQEARRTREELEKEREEERKKKRKLEYQKTLASRIQAARVKTEKEFQEETGFSRPPLTLPSTQKRLARGAGSGSLRGAITGPGVSSTGGGTSSTATAGQIAAARMREIPTPATPTPATHVEAASAVPLASAASAPVAAAPVEPSSEGANADAGASGVAAGSAPEIPSTTWTRWQGFSSSPAGREPSSRRNHNMGCGVTAEEAIPVQCFRQSESCGLCHPARPGNGHLLEYTIFY